ncbi:MAG: ribonuclease H [Planctomycetota bacterium]
MPVLSPLAQRAPAATLVRMNDLARVTIFSDGGSKPNPGPGGWAAILKYPDKAAEKELSGYEAETTNNRMELTAVTRALQQLKRPCSVTVVTDSEYLANAFRQGWLAKWKRNGWKTASKEPVKNQDLWVALDALMSQHQVTWQWVRGHTGHPENERCDELATRARESRGADVET